MCLAFSRSRHQSLPGQAELILCGFHEGALAAQKVYHYVYPQKADVPIHDILLQPAEKAWRPLKPPGGRAGKRGPCIASRSMRFLRSPDQCHVDIIESARALCDELVVAIGVHPARCRCSAPRNAPPFLRPFSKTSSCPRLQAFGAHVFWPRGGGRARRWSEPHPARPSRWN